MSRIDDARARRGPGPIEKAWTAYGVRWAHQFAKDPFVAYVAFLALNVAAFFVGALTSGLLVWWWLS